MATTKIDTSQISAFATQVKSTVSDNVAFEDLSDVDMTGIADGDMPKWDAADQLWKPGQGGSLSDYALLQEVILTTTSTTDIHFSNIDQTYRDLIIVGMAQVNIGNNNDDLNMVYNGDWGGTNYDAGLFDHFEWTQGLAQGFQTIAALGFNNNILTAFEATIVGYTLAQPKQMWSFAKGKGGGNFFLRQYCGQWNISTGAAITDIILRTHSSSSGTGNNLIAGSRAALYGRGKVVP